MPSKKELNLLNLEDVKTWFKLIRNLFSIFGILVFVFIILLLFFCETSKQRRNIFFIRQSLSKEKKERPLTKSQSG